MSKRKESSPKPEGSKRALIDKAEISSTDWRLDLTFAQRAQSILDDEKWSDCTLILGENQETIKAHKAFLTSASPVFEIQFYGSLADGTAVKISDFNANYFKLFLQYVYTGNIMLNSFKDADIICRIAHLYMIPDLFRTCVDRLWDFLSPKTVVKALDIALLFNDKELEETSLDIIRNNTSDCLKYSGFQSVNVTTVERILDMDDLNISSENELHKALKKWARRVCSWKAEEGERVEMRSVVSTTLPKLRFLTIRAETFAKKVNFELLTKEEHHSILLNIMNPGCKTPMAPGFSKSRVLRNRNWEVNTSVPVSASGSAAVAGNSHSTNGKHSKDKASIWIRNVKITNVQEGTATVTTIHFQVAKKITILGVQVKSNVPKKSPEKSNSNERVYQHVTCIDLYTSDGKLVSTSHKHDKFYTGNIKITENILERNTLYALKLCSCESTSSVSVDNVNGIESFGEVKFYKFESLPINYFAFITKH